MQPWNSNNPLSICFWRPLVLPYPRRGSDLERHGSLLPLYPELSGEPKCQRDLGVKSSKVSWPSHNRIRPLKLYGGYSCSS
jgi:hypothetical protein